MAITGTVRRDVTYPIVGNAVTGQVDGVLAGHRIRWRLASAPPLSDLPVYNETTPTVGWLQVAPGNGGVLVPDTHGVFVLEAVEESFAPSIPHFDLDPTGSIDEWTEVATSSYSLFVGRRVKRTLGADPNTVDLVANVVGSSASAQGVMTARYSQDLAPHFGTPASDLAAAAVGDDDVRDLLAYFGGFGYTGDANLIEVDGVFCASPSDTLSRLTTAFDRHIGYTGNYVHVGADATNVMSGVSAPTTEVELAGYVNTLAEKYTAHIAAAPSVHVGADTVNVLSSLIAIGLAASITRLNDIRYAYSCHRVLNSSSVGHHSPGDGTISSLESWRSLPSTSTLATAIAYAVDLAAAYDHHLLLAIISTAYHASADTDNVLGFTDVYGTPDLIAKANALADAIEAHASGDYHTTPDVGCVIPFRAQDLGSAIQVLDYAIWAMYHHTCVAGPWHGGSVANAGEAYCPPVGAVSRLQFALLSRLTGTTFSIPSSAVTAIEDMINLGGFSLS